MDWGYKAALTASLVAAVMMAMRLFDRRWAGLLAGAPVITAPALLWLAHDQGAAFAAHSAVGSVMASAVAPVFAVGYIVMARVARPLACTVGASALGLLAAWLLQGLQGQALLSLLVAISAGALALAWLGPIPPGSWVRPLRGEPWLSAGVAGAVTALVGLLAPGLGAFWVGALTGLPLIAGCALVHLHRAGTAANLRRFAQGYVIGIVAKAGFAFVFAQSLGLGIGWALLAATGTGAVVMLALSAALSALSAGPRRQPAGRAPSPALPTPNAAPGSAMDATAPGL